MTFCFFVNLEKRDLRQDVPLGESDGFLGQRKSLQRTQEMGCIFGRTDELVSIQKWPFSAISASICGIPCAAYYTYASAESLDFLDLTKKFSFLIWKPLVCIFLIMDGHELGEEGRPREEFPCLPIPEKG
jgi:hypothetical protein